MARRIWAVWLLGAGGCLPDLEPGPDGQAPPGVPPPIVFEDVDPTIGGDGLVEHHVSSDNAHPDGTYQVNLSVRMRNLGDDTLRITKVIPHWTGHGDGDLVLPVGELFEKTGGPDTVLAGEQFSTVGARLDEGVADGILGGWRDVVGSTNVHLIGNVFDEGSHVVLARYESIHDMDVQLGVVERLFPSAKESWPGPIVYDAGSVLVSAVVESAAAGAQVQVGSAWGGDLSWESGFEPTVVPLPAGCTPDRLDGMAMSTGYFRSADGRPGLLGFEALALTGDATCGGDRRGFLAVIRRDDLTLVESFGDDGVLLFDPPGSGETRMADVEIVKIGSDGSTFVVAANRGSGCAVGDPGTAVCTASIGRFFTDGAPDGAWGTDGWREIDVGDDVHAARVVAMVFDDEDRILFGGWADRDRDGAPFRQWLIGRWQESGLWDHTFGIAETEPDIDALANPYAGDGFLIHPFSGRPGAIEDLAVDHRGIVAAGWSEFADGKKDFAVGRYTEGGAEIGGDDGFRVWHTKDDAAIPSAVTIDYRGAAFTVGRGPGARWAVTRHREDGRLDSTEWMDPGEAMTLRMPDERLFFEAPTQLELQVFAAGYSVPAVLQLPLKVHELPDLGGYLFPLDSDDLLSAATFRVSQHHLLGNDHPTNTEQRYALDIVAERWTGSGWSSVFEDGDPKVNEDRVVYGVDVLAMADGEILRCFRTLPNNPEVGVKDEDVIAISGGGNGMWIRHETGELALYAHFEPLSVPESLCPADGTLNPPIAVTRGTVLGRVGNSGSSTGPHLHVHVQRGSASLLPGEEVEGGVPLIVEDLLSQPRTDELGDTWFILKEQALAPATRVK